MIARATALVFSFGCSLAAAQPLPLPGGGGGSPRPPALLLADGVSVGCVCGSTTVADIIKTYNLPAGQLANVGDMIHVVTGGAMQSNTNIKTARVRFGGVGVNGLATGSTGAQTGWISDSWIIKTGPNTQSFWTQSGVLNLYSAVLTGTLTQTDTAPIAITVDGLNATATGAGAITTQTLIVQYFPAN